MGHILVTDDVATNRELLRRRLEKEGHTVTEAEHGLEALEHLRATPFDLVLLDIQMPLMDGYGVLQEMKKDPKLFRIPVVVISAVDELESVVRCIELGAVDYLSKPFNSSLLKARVDASLEKKFLRDQVEEEKKRGDALLNAIFPPAVVEELKRNEKIDPSIHDNVGILFCDVCDFTQYCNEHTPQEVVDGLQILVDEFEKLSIQMHIQKIKTNGDSFMSAAGLIAPSENPTLECVRCGMEMMEIAPKIGAHWQVRVGIHVGPVMAGIVGHKQYLFDIWGDTVNIAARLAEHGSIGSVTVSEAAFKQVSDYYEGISLGIYPIKGKGNVELFRVLHPKPAAHPQP